MEPGRPFVRDELVVEVVARGHVRHESAHLGRHVVFDEPELGSRPAIGEVLSSRLSQGLRPASQLALDVFRMVKARAKGLAAPELHASTALLVSAMMRLTVRRATVDNSVGYFDH